MIGKERLTIESLLRVARISDPQISPDGRFAAFTVSTALPEKNRIAHNIWLAETVGGSVRQLTFAEEGRNARPRWSPDSQSIAFLSDRAEGMQIWKMSVGGGEARRLTSIPTDIDSFLWSPAGNQFAAVSYVYPHCADPEANKKKKQETSERSVKMRAYTEIPIRRWDEWLDERRAHILLLDEAGGFLRDLTPGDFDSPAWMEGGPDCYAFSPDGEEICFNRIIGNEALDGKRNLFAVPISGGEARRISNGPAVDFAPRYSPDGRYIGYLASTRPLLDGDHAFLTLYERATDKHIRFCEDLDRSVSSFVWLPDGKSVWFTVEDEGEENLYELDIESGKRVRCLRASNINDITTDLDGKRLVYTSSSFNRPPEIYMADRANEMSPKQLTHLNDEWSAGIEWGEWSLFEYKGWKDERVCSWMFKPPDFSPDKQYPLLLMIHGGPHGAWMNNFHYRWNPQIFAAAGYIVIAPNFHGSSSYGQAFTDYIRGDWSSAPYEDLMKAVDEAAKRTFVDETRLAAAGASYGGYMANWIAGQTDRFRCIISHDGLFNLVTSIYTSDFAGGALEELGGTVWQNIEAIHRQSPSSHAKNYSTPMLIVHGQLDYRVDLSDGVAIFQTLRAKGVPAKFLYFPDENHWVLKPGNSLAWYKEVLDWLAKWTKD